MNENFISIFAYYLILSLEIGGITFLCIRFLDNRRRFAVKCLIFSLSLFLIAFCCSLMKTYLSFFPSETWDIVFYAFLYMILILFAFSCFEGGAASIFFCLNGAFTTFFISDKITKSTVALLKFNGIEVVWYLEEIISIVIAGAVSILALLFFIHLYRDRITHLIDRSALYLCMSFIAVSVVLTLCESYISRFDPSYLVILYFCELLYGFICLFMSYALIRQEESEFELSMIRQLWNEDRKQYELQKESMDMINIKCHDLKHQIQALRGKDLNDKMMEEIEESIDFYNSKIQTENEVLDVILSNMILRCRKYEIQLTCMADGKSLEFMEDTDIYSLFGNMLENALEYEMKVEKKENRFISLTVSRNGGFVSIHAENYFVGDAAIENGLIRTTKQNRNDHGFGMKSMKKIVEKYNGAFEVIIADKMFQVDMLIPMKKESGYEK